MTDQSKPCFPGCRSLQYNHGANYLHIPGCPNDKPAPCRFCGHTGCTLEWCECSACQNAEPAPAQTSGYIAPVSVPGSADRVWDKPATAEAPKAELCTTCSKEEMLHHGSMHGFRKPAPAEAPKACPRCGVPFSRRGIYHSEGGCYETGIRKSTPAPASVTPASDTEVAKIGTWNCDCSTKGPNHPWQCLMVFGPRLIARIESEKAQNAELRAQVEELCRTRAYEREESDRILNAEIEQVEALRARVEVPQKSERYRQMMEAAEAYFRLLRESGPGADGVDAAEARLNELAAPFSDDPAFQALLKLERASQRGMNRNLQDTIDASIGFDSMCRDGHEGIRYKGDCCPMCDLRARLAEVSAAAMAVVSNSDMATPPTIAAMAALEAILAKGDGK